MSRAQADIHRPGASCPAQGGFAQLGQGADRGGRGWVTVHRGQLSFLMRSRTELIPVGRPGLLLLHSRYETLSLLDLMPYLQDSPSPFKIHPRPLRYHFPAQDLDTILIHLTRSITPGATSHHAAVHTQAGGICTCIILYRPAGASRERLVTTRFY